MVSHDLNEEKESGMEAGSRSSQVKLSGNISEILVGITEEIATGNKHKYECGSHI